MKKTTRRKRPSLERLMEIAQGDGNVGICAHCGEERDCCEPDARKYKCDYCGENAVYGAEEWLIAIGM